MKKIYLICLIVVVGTIAYVCGAKIADARCQMRVAQTSLINMEYQQKQILQNKRILHDQVYKTGVADIRRILLSKYTIAE